MIKSPTFLEKAHELKVRGVEFPLEVGASVARGYADLGTEVFQLIGPKRLVSLFTGKTSELPDEHLHFFFRVPEVEELVDEFARRGVRVLGLSFKDQRRWVLGLEVEGETREFISNSLEETLLDGLLSLLSPPQEVSNKPRLKSVKE
jgi:hypothetical protein